MDIEPVVVAHASPGPAVSTSSPFPHFDAAVKWESCTEEISYSGGVQEVQDEPDFSLSQLTLREIFSTGTTMIGTQTRSPTMMIWKML